MHYIYISEKSSLCDTAVTFTSWSSIRVWKMARIGL